MATPLTHPLFPLVAGLALGKSQVPGRVLLTGVLLSLLPDLDVLTFRLGIPYRHMLGHRGLTHSIAFAAIAAFVAAFFCRVSNMSRWGVVVFLFLSVLSHGFLDAITDGGMGVAFLAPWSGKRYHFPWQILKVSPLGTKAFSSWGAAALVTEMRRVWLPAFGILSLVSAARKYWRRRCPSSDKAGGQFPVYRP